MKKLAITIFAVVVLAVGYKVSTGSFDIDPPPCWPQCTPVK
ncbi:MAG TPA: hypothetical protein VNL17_14295 [Verrucomicrobiae bacterium]|nr:hypothetical protein [Verrucomicrobiae bacterium]